jgi:hypothetical protein
MRDPARRAGTKRRLLALAAFVGVMFLLAVSLADQTSLEGWPWQAAGRLGVGEVDRGGVVLVAPRTALTVRHCVPENLPAERPDLKVRLAGQLVEVASLRRSPRPPLAAGRIRSLGDDWVVLTLDPGEAVLPRPVAPGGLAIAQLAFLTRQSLTKFSDRAAAGQPATIAQSTGCRIREFDREQRLLVYRCTDGLGIGVSGTPFVARTRDGWALIGLQSAKSTGPGGTVGIIVVPPDDAAPAP